MTLLEWYDIRENLLELYNFLNAVDLPVEEYELFLEKPWKWDDEYRIMKDNPDWNNYDQDKLDKLQAHILGDEDDEE